MRRKWSGHDVPEPRELLEPLAAGEGEHLRRVVEVRDDAAVSRELAAQHRQEPRGLRRRAPLGSSGATLRAPNARSSDARVASHASAAFTSPSVFA